MSKICVCGHFAKEKESFNGQTIKTKNIYNQLVKKYGEYNVSIIDTYNWKKHPLRLFSQCIVSSKNSDHIVILPAHKGFKIFVPLFNFLKKKKRFKLHYIVIGGWLYSLVKNNRRMKKELSKTDYIYLENNKTISQLKKLGLNNLYKMNNFKELKVSKYKKVNTKSGLTCCIFSRIEEKKGISNAIKVIKRINKETATKVTLDIYGQVSDEYKNNFAKLLKGEEYIFYKGTVDPNRSVETIEKYDLLLFPTLYYTEGIPGTIIDSFFSGVPVLASRWENYDEILEDNKTGYSFIFQNDEDFYQKLKEIAKNKNIILKLKNNCKERAKEYTPENSMRVLVDNIGD